MTGAKLTMLIPMGCPPRMRAKPMAPRLDCPDGKTVSVDEWR